MDPELRRKEKRKEEREVSEGESRGRRERK